MKRNYRGWQIYYCPSEPATGRFVAYKYGVTIRANDETLLTQMIDNRDTTFCSDVY